MSRECEHHAEHLGRILIVFGNENATCRCAGRRNRLAVPAALLDCALRDDRQADVERASPTRAFAARLDAAAMHFNEPTRKRETNPQAAPRALERVIELREHVEHLRQELRRDAHARIGDTDERNVTVG
jgi:hypothetical protein